MAAGPGATTGLMLHPWKRVMHAFAAGGGSAVGGRNPCGSLDRLVLDVYQQQCEQHFSSFATVHRHWEALMAISHLMRTVHSPTSGPGSHPSMISLAAFSSAIKLLL